MEEARLNEKIAEIFFEMADILELKEIKWKPQAYRIAGQTLESLKKDVLEIYSKEGVEGLKKLPGIGEALADKIKQYIETEKIDEYEKLKKSVPKGLYEIMKIPGVGVKKASLFFKSGIKNPEQLEKAARENKLLKIEGFKEKSEENILKGIELMKASERRPLKDAKKIAYLIVRKLEKIKDAKKVVIAGSIRREKSTIGDIDIVILTDNSSKISDEFVRMDFVKQVLGKGKEKTTIITKDNIQVDLRFFNDEEFGAGLLYFTGDKNHNIWLRKIAIKKGWKLNEYGLFDGEKRIAGKTEKEIYDKLDVKMVEPKDRIGETN